MSDLINKWLYDILESINSINEYIGDQKYFDIYENNKQLRRSVEREIEIIGEAISSVSQKTHCFGVLSQKTSRMRLS